MARGARGDIPGSSLGQVFINILALTHVYCNIVMFGVPSVLRRYDAGVRRAADGRRSLPKTSPCTAMSILHAVFCGDRTQQHPLSASKKQKSVAIIISL